MTDKTKKQEKQNIVKTDGQSVPQTTANAASVYSWIFGSVQDATSLINQLDTALTSLANLNLEPDCKQISKEKKSQKDIWTDAFSMDELGKTTAGCNPFKDLSIFQQLSDPSAKEPSASQVAADIITIVNKLTGPSAFPSCVFETYRKFLSAVPTEYFLLLAVGNIAKAVKKPIEEIVDVQKNTPCGDVGIQKKLLRYENAIPEINIPLIPGLPYIQIPDLTDIIENIIYETICFGLCAITTPIINAVGKSLLQLGDDYQNYIFDVQREPDSVGEIVPLNKVSIKPFLDEVDLTEANNYLQSLGVSLSSPRDQIIKYVLKVQEDDDVLQEDFIFLLLGKMSCQLYDKVNKIDETKSIFKLDDEQKVVNFFSIIGSLINMFLLARASKAKVCPPDPCDLKDELDPDIVNAINNLCSLLNPASPPDVPTDQLLSAAGVDESLAESSESSNNVLSGFNKSYNPENDPQNEETLKTSYLQRYYSGMSIATYTFIPQGNLETELNIKEQIDYGVKKYLNYCFPFSDVRLLGEEINKPKTASSDDFKRGFATIPGLSPLSNFKYNVYLENNKETFLKRIKEISKQVGSTAGQNQSNMDEFKDLRKDFIG